MNPHESKKIEDFDFERLNKQYVVKIRNYKNASKQNQYSFYLEEKKQDSIQKLLKSTIKSSNFSETYVPLEKGIELIKSIPDRPFETKSDYRATLCLCKDLNDLLGVDSLPKVYIAANDGTPYTWTDKDSNYLQNVLFTINEALGYKNVLPKPVDKSIVKASDFSFTASYLKVSHFKRLAKEIIG